MVRHLFKTIWNERKVNIWIFLELVLIFCILWFSVEYLSLAARRYMESPGYDIAGTYRIEVGIEQDILSEMLEDDELDEQEYAYEHMWKMLETVKSHPGVEYAAWSVCLAPYFTGSCSTGVRLDSDTTDVYVYWAGVTPEYFDVFRIPVLKGRTFTMEEFYEGVVVLGDGPVLWFGDEASTVPYTDASRVTLSYTEEEETFRVLGVVDKVKRFNYEDYIRVMYKPLTIDEIDEPEDLEWMHLAVRVREGYRDNFEEDFMNTMEDRLETGPFFLSTVKPYGAIKGEVLGNRFFRHSDNIKNALTITMFLFLNIFLAVIGTFWFRTQSRRGEIGLRMALGASARTIRRQFVGESVLLLSVASALGTVICVNLGLADVVNSKWSGIPSAASLEFARDAGVFLTDFLLVFMLLLLITVLAVWYPARTASKVSPTDALRDE